MGSYRINMGLVDWLIWPVLILVPLVLTGYAMGTDHPVMWFNVIYIGFALTVGGLERLHAYEPSWLRQDGQTLVNLAHTVLNKGLVQLLVVVAGSVGLAGAVQPPAGAPGSIWPSSWPLAVQVVLALVVAEFGLYWAHRLAHEIPLIWRFHAVHHSATRLWFINTGRFHFVDTIFSILLSQPLLYILGAPVEIFLWVSATTAFIGMMTHCNIATRTGFLNYLFNTPRLHRWHHSRNPDQGNRNYGENLMVWDLVFRTWYDADERPPADIGINGPMPASFSGQLAAPFRPSYSPEAST